MKLSSKDPTGTSFWGSTVLATYNQLCEILGGPPQGGGSSKSLHDWTCETELGELFTVYDWKEYRDFGKDEPVYFHIGGHNEETTELAKKEIEKKLIVEENRDRNSP